jgi:hypothetical protein
VKEPSEPASLAMTAKRKTAPAKNQTPVAVTEL